VPFFFFGIPSGHDFEFHLNSWMEVLGQWKQGVVYPRWASLANFGYGEARFLFYPPFSWALGAGLGAVLPWKLVPAAYIWIALSLSGCTMFFLARPFLQPRDALFTAVLYAVNPYHLVIVYWRSAFAELLAAPLLPLLLLLVLRSKQDGRRAVPLLSLVIAAAWLTNAPSAVIVNYSIAMLVLATAVQQRSLTILVRGAVATLFGAALAAFYLIPAAYEQKWVQIAQVLSPGVRPEDNFLFTSINDADHNRFNLLISIVACAGIVLLAVAIAFLVRSQFLKHSDDQGRSSMLYGSLIVWGVASSLLMLSLSSAFYRVLPELRFVQLPWRWLLCLNAALALLLTKALSRWLTRAVVCAAMLAVLVLVWRGVQPPWWDTAADIAEMRDNQEEHIGYEGADEYAPKGADPSEIKRNARRATFEGSGASQIQIHSWAPESKTLTANVSTPGRLILRLFNYPAWRVEVNGSATESETQEATGQMMIPVQAGENQVRIAFMRTRDRAIGGLISLLAVPVMLVMFYLRRQ
jgi:6-pyruvoyl-tetrahydropterin synthase related domain